MDETTFWKLIAESRKPGEAMEDQATRLTDALAKLPPAEIEAFQRFFDQKMNASYAHDLWGAAYLIMGGCSDDGFEYFRGWLISRGRDIYTAAVANPDALAALDKGKSDADFEFEEFLYIAREAYQRAAGEEIPRVSSGWPREPHGEEWDFDDMAEMAKRLPKLSAKYG